jgi:hypothetical protein
MHRNLRDAVADDCVPGLPHHAEGWFVNAQTIQLGFGSGERVDREGMETGLAWWRPPIRAAIGWLARDGSDTSTNNLLNRLMLPALNRCQFAHNKPPATKGTPLPS